MNKALEIYDDGQFDIMQRTAKALVASGYFRDTKDMAQATVKIMAGAELGIAPFASMTGIHIIQGKPAIGANLIATLIKNDPRYDYKIIQCDDNVCVLAWFESGVEIGSSSFKIDEAKRAGLTGKENWKKYPSDMLFARAVSRGSKRFAPGVFGGAPVYTPDELGADVDPDGYIEAEIITHPVVITDNKMNSEYQEDDAADNAAALEAEISGAAGPDEYIETKIIPQPDDDDDMAAALEAEIFGTPLKPAKKPAAKPAKKPAVKPANKPAKSNSVDWAGKAMGATSESAFYSAASFFVDGYTSAEHVKNALAQRDDFEYDPANNAELLQWLADRKVSDSQPELLGTAVSNGAYTDDE